MAKGTMILHCGGKSSTFDEVCSIEPPENTDTYKVVPHGDLVRLCMTEVENSFGVLDTQPERTFGLANDGKRMFGTVTYNMIDAVKVGEIEFLREISDEIGEDAFKRYGFSICMRNSYDFSMSVGIAGGASTFNCDNLSISGSDFTIKMKHTKNIWNKIVPEVIMRVRKSIGDWKENVILLENLRKNCRLSDEQAYEIIGIGQGRGILTPMQASNAFREYHDCRKGGHVFSEDHGSAFALYQHFTESLKLGKDMPRKLDRYTGVSGMFKDRFRDQLSSSDVEEEHFEKVVN